MCSRLVAVAFHQADGLPSRLPPAYSSFYPFVFAEAQWRFPGGVCLMGLDAVVFCNCVEMKRLKVPHPFPKLLYVESNGSPEIRSQNRAKVDRHDEWMALPPCRHRDMLVAGV